MTIQTFKKALFSLFFMAIGFVGTIVGRLIMNRYEIIVNGILGLVVLFLLIKLFPSPKSSNGGPFNDLFDFPRNIKYSVYGFFLALILYWSAKHVLTFIAYIPKIFEQ